MTVNDLLKQTIEGLEAAGIENARREAEQIVCAVLKKDRSYFIAHGSDVIGGEPVLQVNKKTIDRAFGMPLQYVIGTSAFMDMELGVDDRVLIPRPETELLAERAEAFLAERFAKEHDGEISVVDLCTGSGAIALYLARRFPLAAVTAADISQPALQVTIYNNMKYDAGLNIVRSDLFENIEGTFDLITANPPYIPTTVIDTLDPVVKDKEPRLALDGGDDGLDIVRRLVSEAPQHLKAGGMLLMEHGHDQGEACRLLALNAGFASASTLKDLEGHDRILFARL